MVYRAADHFRQQPGNLVRKGSEHLDLVGVTQEPKVIPMAH